ncbi:MAG: AAA family ATPase [Euryarchaeota archaeon]|nr:AAA family ATPase [Euryarchaeota archaeon]MCG2736646.1 AAA domain-containing protein [Candidatus Methanoperedenaceae archaeon]
MLKDKYSNLVNYYIECIEEEDIKGLSFHKNKANTSFLELPISFETFSTENQNSFHIPTTINLTNYLNKQDNQQKKTLGNRLFYGYPVIVGSDGIVNPLFYTEIEISEGPNKEIIFTRLQHNNYNFNRYVFRYLGIDFGEISNDEIDLIISELEHFDTPKNLNEFVWIDSKGDQIIPSTFVVKVLQACRSLGYEGFDFKNNSVEKLILPNQKDFNILKSPIIFFNPKTETWRGVLKELRALVNLKYSTRFLNKISENSTSYFFQPENLKDISSPTSQKISEIYLLDSSQEVALKQSLSKNVTVITGAPGTGKSQVVCNILVNAMEQGQTVIFVSKNHKAVDVVKKKLEEIFNDKIIRYGNSENTKEANLKLEKISKDTYLNSLSVLSSQQISQIHEKINNLDKEIELFNIKVVNIQTFQNQIDIVRNKLIEILKKLPEDLQKSIESNIQKPKPEFINLLWKESDFIDLHQQIKSFESELATYDEKIPTHFKKFIDESHLFLTNCSNNPQIEFELNQTEKTELHNIHYRIEDESKKIQDLSKALPESLRLCTQVMDLGETKNPELYEIVGNLAIFNNRLKSSLLSKIFWSIPAWFNVRKYKIILTEKYFEKLNPELKEYVDEIFIGGANLSDLLDCYHKIIIVQKLCIYQREKRKYIEDFNNQFTNILTKIPVNDSNHIKQHYSKEDASRKSFVDLAFLIDKISKLIYRIETAKNELQKCIKAIISSCPDYLQKYCQQYLSINEESNQIRIIEIIYGIVTIETSYLEIENLNKNLKICPPESSIYQSIINLKLERQELCRKLIESNWNSKLKNNSVEIKRVIEQFLEAQSEKYYATGIHWAKLNDKWGEYFEQLLQFLPIWITVSLSAQYIPLKSNLFDLLVVDEASQCDIPSAIPLFFRAKRVVIIGDPWQLKHISTIQKEKEIKIAGKCDVMQLLPDYSYREKSLYGLGERVLSYSNQKPIRLEKHYRSHHKIISFSDAQFYNYLSFCTDESKLKSINEYGVKWIDVHGKAEKDDNDKWVNKKEAEEVVKFLKRYIAQNKSVISYGIVTPFRGQVNFLNHLVSELEADISVGTTETFQGDEKDVMIFSPVVSTGIGNFAKKIFSQDPNRINVAVTRARSLLVIIGDKQICRSLDRNGLLYQLLGYTEKIESKDGQEFSLSVPEKILWDKSKERNIRLFPQFPLRGYDLDFAYFSKGGNKWDIEIDGYPYHEDAQKDALREKHIKDYSWQVKRFTAHEVLNNIEQVIEEIERLI